MNGMEWIKKRTFIYNTQTKPETRLEHVKKGGEYPFQKLSVEDNGR